MLDTRIDYYQKINLNGDITAQNRKLLTKKVYNLYCRGHAIYGNYKFFKTRYNVVGNKKTIGKYIKEITQRLARCIMHVLYPLQ